MAFPRLNALSFWLLLAGGIVFYASIFWSPPEAGWTSYPPLSSILYSPSGGQDAWIYLIHLTGLSSILGAINFYVTIANMRAKGMSWGRLPLFVWAILTYSVLLIFALPVIAAAVTMLLTDRHFGTHFFDQAEGGSPLLWQNLFWFFGHPEVYIMVLPGFGIVSEILPVFARKPIFGYKAIAASTVAIAFLGFLTWAHHMFTTPIPEAILVFVMLSSFLIAVPTGVKMLNWLATLWRGTIEFKTPLLFCVGFLALFLIGGISGVFLAVFPVDWQLNETYFVVAHIHFVLMGGAVFTIFAGIYYWFPKITGRMLNESLGKASFYLMFFGFLMTFLIQHVIGLDGMPRRVYEYDNVGHLALYNQISTVGSFVLAAGVIATIINVWRSSKFGVIAGPDPWKANTLEWFTASPPPVNNFDAVPVVRSAEPMKDIRREIERRNSGAHSGGGATVPSGATQVGV
jgi:heme/copper-type cytochrome/quinol oxidase subunit 1